MAEVTGIETLKKLIKELVAFGTVVDKQLEDGFQWTDAFPIGMEGKNLMFVVTGWSTVKAEFEDLSVEEIEQLVEELAADLNITNTGIVDLIGKSVAFAEAAYELFKSIKAFKAPATPAV